MVDDDYRTHLNTKAYVYDEKACKMFEQQKAKLARLRVESDDDEDED